MKEELEVSQDPGGKERVKKGYMSFWKNKLGRFLRDDYLHHKRK